MSDKQWWEPKVCDKGYFDELREEYPERAHLSDDELHEHFNDGRKYSITWDHIGDAYCEYEKLADAYLELKEKPNTEFKQ